MKSAMLCCIGLLFSVNTYSAPSDNSFPYFEKTGGSLDFMGVSVTRTSTSQQVWAPGTAEREYPGGWLTPGDYTVTINTVKVHHQLTGVFSGQLHADASHQLMGRVISRPYNDGGWPNHSFDAPAEIEPQEWGTSRTVTLATGEVLHVAYGNEIVAFQKRSGSDGQIFYCVETEPEPRSGLWSTAPDRSFDADLWSKLEEAVLANGQFFTPGASVSYVGPASISGALSPWISDFGQEAENIYGNTMSGNLSTFLMNRGYSLIRKGSMTTAERNDLTLLLEYYLNMVQHCFQWGDASGQHYCMSHGIGRYPPYEAWGFAGALVAAVALGVDPGYEPLFNKMALWAQRPDITLPHSNSYNYGNTGSDIITTLSPNAYTDWLINDLGLTDISTRGGHRESVWGIAYWARCVLDWPETPYSREHLWHSGYGVKNYGLEPWAFRGHEWNPDGSAAGHNLGYGRMEHNGIIWLWFTGVARHTEQQRYARRNWFVKTFQDNTTLYPGIPKLGGYWCSGIFSTWLNEVTGLQAAAQSTHVGLNWTANTDATLDHYRVYRGADVQDITTVINDDVSGTSFNDGSVQSNTIYYYAVAAVDGDGNEGSRSDADTVTTGTLDIFDNTGFSRPLIHQRNTSLFLLNGSEASSHSTGVLIRRNKTGNLTAQLILD